MKKHDMQYPNDIINNSLLNIADSILNEYSKDIIKTIRKNIQNEILHTKIFQKLYVILLDPM